jgi:tRNA pseudouridine55 synthase
MIHDAALSMTGTLDQVPPVFSAIKVNGQRAYKKARSGEELVLKSRQIQIYAFEITSIALPYVHFRVECSKGTYIRSLAHDFGKKLDSGAYLEKLVRTRIGEHRLEDAYQLPQFEQWVKSMQQNEGH